MNKNVLLFSIKPILILIGVFFIRENFASYPLAPEKYIGTLMTSASIILAGLITATFTFSYSKIKKRAAQYYIFAHLISLILLLGIALLFYINIWLLFPIVGGHTEPITIASIIIYLSILLYDGWDYFNNI